MSTHLKLGFRLNACPVCLVCLVCTKIYGEDCSCQPIDLNKKHNKYITRVGVNKKKIGMIENLLTGLKTK